MNSGQMIKQLFTHIAIDPCTGLVGKSTTQGFITKSKNTMTKTPTVKTVNTIQWHHLESLGHTPS